MMDSVEPYIITVVTLLGVAYPLLFQSVARFEEKYKSQNIMGLFNKESKIKYFQYVLYISLFLIVIWSLNLPVSFKIEIIDDWWFISDSAYKLLVAIFTIILVFLFFRFLKKIDTYHIDEKLSKHLIKKHEKEESSSASGDVLSMNVKKLFNALDYILLRYISNVKTILYLKKVKKNKAKEDPNDFFPKHNPDKQHKSVHSKDLFNALGDLLLRSISNEDTSLFYKMKKFFIDTIAKKETNNSKAGERLEYPDNYYELINKATKALATTGRGFNPGNTIVDNSWLLWTKETSFLSGKTYRCMWENLLISVESNRYDFILSHWKNATNFYETSYYSGYNHSNLEYNYSNKIPKDKLDFERDKFFKFHFFLGGLIMSKKKYSCIMDIFRYTNQSPPKYPLLPDCMDEIFDLQREIFLFYDYDKGLIKEFLNTCRFPSRRTGGIDEEGKVIKYIRSYMAVLFLRQYILFLPTNIRESQRLAFHNNIICGTESEIENWKYWLKYFKETVSSHLENKELLEETGLDIITREWCKENKKTYPLDWIDDFKSELENCKKNVNYKRSHKTENDFLQKYTKEIIEKFFDKISGNLYNSKQAVEIEKDTYKHYDFEEWNMELENRDYFTVNYSNTKLKNSAINQALDLKNKIFNRIAETFLESKTETFLFKPDYLFKAIDRLKLSKDHIIVVFGLDIDKYKNDYKIKGLESDKYKNTPIFHCKSILDRDFDYLKREFDEDIEFRKLFGLSGLFGYSEILNSVFILKKSDLPVISTKPEEDRDIIEEYSLENIDVGDNKKMYASVVVGLDKKPEDFLDKTKKIIDKSNDCNTYFERPYLEKMVLMGIRILLRISWKKDAKVIQIEEYYYENRENELPNKLYDVKPF